MKTTGIIRRIDELGRIVIPKEIRKTLKIKDNDSLEIFVENNNIILKKYSFILNIRDVAVTWINICRKFTDYSIVITDTDKIIACSSDVSDKYLNKDISENILVSINRRDNYAIKKKRDLKITPDDNVNVSYVFSTIIHNGDTMGAIILLSNDHEMTEIEEKIGLLLTEMINNLFID